MLGTLKRIGRRCAEAGMTSRGALPFGCGDQLAGGCGVLRRSSAFRSVRYSCIAPSGDGSGTCGAAPEGAIAGTLATARPVPTGLPYGGSQRAPVPRHSVCCRTQQRPEPGAQTLKRDLFWAAGSNAHPDRDLRLHFSLPVRNCAKRREWCTSDSSPGCKSRTPDSDDPCQDSCQPENSEGVTR